MASLNKVLLIGRVGRDPEVRQTTSGKSVANLSLATTDGYGDKKTTEWHRITIWDKQADFVARYVSKGDLLYIEGRIQTRSWEKDGEKKYQTEIVAFSVQSLETKKKDDDDTPPF